MDLGNLTSGVLNAEKLLEGNNLLCFTFEVVKTVSPNFLSTIFTLIEKPLRLITDAIGVSILNLDCPAFKDLTVGGNTFRDAISQQFPGAKQAGSVL